MQYDDEWQTNRLTQTPTSSSIGYMDTSLESGYNWLVSYIIRNYSKLEQRVQYDTAKQMRKEDGRSNKRAINGS